MIVAGTSTFTLSSFTVRVRPRFDNPAWAVYLVFAGERLIGKQFSIPTLSDCEWLQRQIYATASHARETSRDVQLRTIDGIPAGTVRERRNWRRK